MTKETKTSTIRKPYHKPQLEQIKLVAEEAVLSGCKDPGGHGPGGGSCNLTGGPGNCSTIGS